MHRYPLLALALFACNKSPCPEGWLYNSVDGT